MKTLFLLLTSILVSGSSAHAATSKKLDLAPLTKYLGNPLFAQALQQASTEAHGLKSRVDYTLIDDRRTTNESFHITIVGKTAAGETPQKFYRSEFDMIAMNSGWKITVKPVVTTEISADEFINFKQ